MADPIDDIDAGPIDDDKVETINMVKDESMKALKEGMDAESAMERKPPYDNVEALKEFLKRNIGGNPKREWAELTSLDEGNIWKIQLTDTGPLAKFTKEVYNQIKHVGRKTSEVVPVSILVRVATSDELTFFHE